MMRNRTKLIATVAIVMATAGIAATPAFAEGTYSASFTNVNPGFASNNWTDHQNDRNATIVSMSSCRLNNGVAVKSIGVQLVDQHGALPDAVVGAAKTMSGCSSVNWAYTTSTYTMRDSTFYWQITAVNGSNGTAYLSGSSVASY